MKIIDNKKDYYDYLMGVYGQDEKIVYDRRGSITYETFLKNHHEISDDEIKQNSTDIELKVGEWVYKFVRNKNTDYKWEMPSEIEEGYWYNKTVYKNPRKFEETKLKNNKEWKKYEDCPVVFSLTIPSRRISGKTKYVYSENKTFVIPNPILSSFEVCRKFISPVDMWNNIYNFISQRYDKPIVDNRTDKEHIESAGFDNKISFRNVK